MAAAAPPWSKRLLPEPLVRTRLSLSVRPTQKLFDLAPANPMSSAALTPPRGDRQAYVGPPAGKPRGRPRASGQTGKSQSHKTTRPLPTVFKTIGYVEKAGGEVEAVILQAKRKFRSFI